MRVFINALCAGNRSGTGRYASELCRALTARDTEETYVILVEAGGELSRTLAGRANVELIEEPARSPLARTVWEATRLAERVRRAKADLFHGLAFTAPRGLPCPAVVTLHDCAFLRYPETIRPLRRFFYRRAIQSAARRAARVAVDSESTGVDARELMGIDAERIQPIPLGVRDAFFVARAPEEVAARLRRQLEVPGDFILTVGTIEPRKNLTGLLRAYGRLRALCPSAPPLVVAGRYGWLSADLKNRLREWGVADHVRWADYVAEDDLPYLMNLSSLFVCLSLYEGFGLPVLEAMAAGAPVLASNTSSLPEVVGPAGALVDPLDPEAVAMAMKNLLDHPARRETLSQAGRQRAKAFTWEKTAQQTRNLYWKAFKPE